MKTLEKILSENKLKELSKEEAMSINGGDSWVRQCADGRTIYYSDNGSTIVYPNGDISVIIYGESVTNYSISSLCK